MKLSKLNPRSFHRLKFPAKRIALFVVLAFGTALSGFATTNKLNVLFIVVDDLRPELGCYNTPVVKSPNLDRLAKRGLVFNYAYCQQAFCCPSRSSVLTGRRPDTTRVYDLVTEFRTALPDVVTLPQYFKQHGYHSQGLSKIYHNRMDDAVSWSVPHWDPDGPVYGPKGRQALRARIAAAKAAGQPTRWDEGVKGPFYDDSDVADNALQDGQTAEKAIAVLREIKAKPFFFAVGFHKPHLPFVAPKKYWDLYSEAELKLAANPFAPTNSPAFALNDWTAELRHYIGIPSAGPLTEEQALKMLHGYYAGISYSDAQVGKVLAELARLGLRTNTVVVLWGDHGWHLGDHGLWGKQTNFEKATRAPLIVSVPGQKSAGQKTEALVELVDLYPTLIELCGLPQPEGLEGVSFRPLLQRPDQPWKRAAFSQQPREIPGYGPGMGYTLRAGRYRFTEWTVPGQGVVSRELYDYQAAPDETENLAAKPELAGKVKELTELLHGGWRAALPLAN